jgi:type II secretory pathway component PulF
MMIDSTALFKSVNGLINTILHPILEGIEQRHEPDTRLGREATADLAILVKRVKRMTSGKVEPSTVEWHAVTDELTTLLKAGGVCKDEAIRSLALEELNNIKAILTEASETKPNKV